MAQLMLVNPRKRRRKTTAKRKSPARSITRRKTRRTVARRRTNPVRRYKRNPIGAQGILNQQVMPALTNASGALALDVVWGYLPVPENIKTGPFRHVAKAAGAIALGMVAGNVVNKSTAKALSQGALTVVIHGAMREIAQQAMPNVPLGYYNAGYPAGMAEYVNGLGAYIGAEGTSPYLSSDNLSTPFAGPSQAEMLQAKLDQCAKDHGVDGYREGAYY